MFAGPRFWTAGPMAAEEQTRRLITLIFAGRNRMVMIRRELPRTWGAGWVRRPCRIEVEEGSPFRGPLRCHRLRCPAEHSANLGRLRELLLLFGFDSDSPDKAEQFASDPSHNLIFVLTARRHRFVPFMQPLLGLPGDLLRFLADGQ